MASHRWTPALLAASALLACAPVHAQYAATAVPSATDLAEAARKDREREDKAEAARVAAAARAEEARRLREERIARCVIKPVMTDAEIDYCRTAGR